MIYKYDKIIAEYISIGGNSICFQKRGFRKYDGIEYFAKICRRSISEWSWSRNIQCTDSEPV